MPSLSKVFIPSSNSLEPFSSADIPSISLSLPCFKVVSPLSKSLLPWIKGFIPWFISLSTPRTIWSLPSVFSLLLEEYNVSSPLSTLEAPFKRVPSLLLVKLYWICFWAEIVCDNVDCIVFKFPSKGLSGSDFSSCSIVELSPFNTCSLYVIVSPRLLPAVFIPSLSFVLPSFVVLIPEDNLLILSDKRLAPSFISLAPLFICSLPLASCFAPLFNLSIPVVSVPDLSIKRLIPSFNDFEPLTSSFEELLNLFNEFVKSIMLSTSSRSISLKTSFVT